MSSTANKEDKLVIHSFTSERGVIKEIRVCPESIKDNWDAYQHVISLELTPEFLAEMERVLGNRAWFQEQDKKHAQQI